MIKKLRRKFIFITMSLVSVILVAVLTGICLFFAQNIRRQSERTLEMLLNIPQGETPPSFQVGGPPPEGFHRDPVFVLSMSKEGEAVLLISERIEVSDTELDAIAQAAIQSGGTHGTLGRYNLRFLARNDASGNTRVAFIDLTEEKNVIRNVVLTCVVVGILALLAFFAVSILLARWALRPVEEAWRQQRRFVSDASHELKTPLTVILANTEILKAHPHDTVATQMNWVENSGEEARRMKGLVDDMLFLAKHDDVGKSQTMSNVNLSDVVAHTALLFESKAYERGVLIAEEITPGVEMQGNEAQLKQLVGILLDNAIKYSKPDGTVTLGLSLRQTSAQLTVHNNGPAIREEEKRHLFERFYRADFSRSEEGYGLGLSIAKSISDAHKGKIAVENIEGKGTTFRITFSLRRE